MIQQFLKTRRFGLSYAELALLIVIIAFMCKLQSDNKKINDAINHPTQYTGK